MIGFFASLTGAVVSAALPLVALVGPVVAAVGPRAALVDFRVGAIYLHHKDGNR